MRYTDESNSNSLKGDRMKKGYWVVSYRSISDAAAVKAYAALAVPVVQEFGGRFLTRFASTVRAHEAAVQQPTVVVEFDSYDIAVSTHESEAYQKALVALGSGAERDFRIVEGA
jgi:uncharacterized protein (DUF1330 family)